MSQLEIVVISVTEEGLSIVQCPACKGTGHVYNNRPHKPCGGTGILTIRHEGPLVICGGCQGSGFKEGFHEPCGGTGLVAAYGEFSIVPRKLT